MGQFDNHPNPQALERAVLKACGDADYRREMLISPKESLAREGVYFSDQARVTVREFDVNDVHIILPPMLPQVRPDTTQPSNQPSGASSGAPRDKASQPGSVMSVFRSGPKKRLVP